MAGDLAERNLISALIDLGLTAVTIVGANLLGIAIGPLVRTSFRTALRCFTGNLAFNNPGDCLWALGESLFNAYLNNFTPMSGINKRSLTLDGYETVSRRVERPGKPSYSVSHTQFMPLGKHLSSLTMLFNRHNGTFAHVYTRTYNNTSQVDVYHRRVNDLGEGDDDGRYHNLRAFHGSVKGNFKRSESSDNGVVMDYLYDEGDQGVFNTLNEEHVPYAEAAANEAIVSAFPANKCCVSGTDVQFTIRQSVFMDSGADGAIATCASPFVLDPSNVFHFGVRGVLAFGWNNQPFKFNGRAKGWVEGCIGLANQ
jgi:hypothetical protein